MHESDEDSILNLEDTEMAGAILTDDDIERWRKELIEIDAKIAHLTERKSMIQNVLGSVRQVEILKGGNTGRLEVLEEGERLSATGTVGKIDPRHMSLVDAIPAVLRTVDQPLSPAEIKEKLPEVGFSKQPGTNYIYTALAKLAERGEVVKLRDGLYAHPSLVKANALVPAGGSA